MAAAWQILKQDPHMLLLPIASSACLMLLTVSWAIPTLFGGFSGPTWPATMHTTEGISSIGAFVFYITTYVVVIFFNAALACCVLRKFEGKPVSIFAGLQEAAGLFPQVLGWALLSATVGVMLKTIERRSGFWGGLVTRMLGLTWTVVTFLVLPVLVAERVGPIDAVRESAQLLRQRWGENLLAGLGFGALYFLWAIPGMLAFVLGASLISTHSLMAIAVMVVAIVYFPVLGLVLSTLSTIFDVVLYRYAKRGMIAPGFDRDLLESSFVLKATR